MCLMLFSSSCQHCHILVVDVVTSIIYLVRDVGQVVAVAATTMDQRRRSSMRLVGENAKSLSLLGACFCC
jgi:hypothetical protein